jgi:hypothetical protein
MEKIYQKIAYWLPKKLVYFAYIRLMAHATTTDEGQGMTPDQMTFSKAVELWERV